MYALDVDTHDSFDNTKRVRNDDTWTRSTRFHGVIHDAKLMYTSRRQGTLDGSRVSCFPILPSLTTQDQCVSRHLQLIRLFSQVSPRMHTTKAFIGLGIVFGGLGAVGGHAATWLLKSRHNRCITLTGKSGQCTIRPISTYPDNVIVLVTRYDAASAAESSEMAKIFVNYAEKSDPSMVTINSGGILRDAIAQRQTPGRLRAVAAPKTLGKFTPSVSSHSKYPLLANCTFSSVTSLVGNVGQTGYAATNAGADVYTREDRESGLPACAIQWGAWAGGGMAATTATLKNRLHHVGIGLIEPATGILALDAAFSF
jgi:hypothetical protein